MADLVITPANVVKSGNPRKNIYRGIAGETLTAGMCVYQKVSDQRLYMAIATQLKTQRESQAIGITLNGATAGQPVTICTGGNINIGATLTVGEVYVVSGYTFMFEGYGKISPYSDLGSTDYVTILGVGISASILMMGINYTGIAKP